MLFWNPQQPGSAIVSSSREKGTTRHCWEQGPAPATRQSASQVSSPAPDTPGGACPWALPTGHRPVWTFIWYQQYLGVAGAGENLDKASRSDLPAAQEPDRRSPVTSSAGSPRTEGADQPGPRSEGPPAVAPSGKAVLLGWKHPQTSWLPSPQRPTVTCRRSVCTWAPPFSLFPSTPPPRTRRLTLSPWVGPMPRSLPLTPSVRWPENAGSATRVPAPPLRTRISSGSGQKRSAFLLLCTEANPEISDRQSSTSRQAQLPRTSTG